MHALRSTMSTTRWGLALAAVALAALPAGAQIRVQAELPQTATAGRAETLTVRLVDGDGKPVAAPRDLAVTVLVEGTKRRLVAELPAGSSELPLRFTSREAAAHTLEIVVEGLDPVWLPWVIVPAAKTRPAPAAADAPPAAAVAGEAAAEPTPAPPPTDLRQVTAVPVILHRQLPAEAPAQRARRLGRRAASEEEAATDAAEPATLDSLDVRSIAVEPDERAFPRQNERVLRRVEIADPASSALGDTAPPPPPPPSPAPPAEPAAEPAAEPTAPPAAAPLGRLRFNPQHLRIPPGSNGLYSRPIQAAWYVGDYPALAESDVVAELQLVEQPEGFALAPDRLRVPASAMTGSVRIEGSRPGLARIQALLPDREVADVVVELLPPQPAALRFSLDQAAAMRRLGPAELRVWARLVDAAGRPTVAPRPLVIDFVAGSGAGGARCQAELPAGEGEVGCDLALSRFDEYALTARARGGGLEVGTAQFDFSFDWALLAWALAGGLLGAAVQVGRRRVKAGEPLVRTYLLGAAAALVVVLLLVFGGLVWLDVAFPEGLRQAAERSSQPALFLLGLLAGFGGEAVFAALDRRFAWSGGKSDGAGPATPPAEGGGDVAPAPSPG